MNAPARTDFNFFLDLAEYFPSLSPLEDYAEESLWWLRTLQEHFGDRRLRVLELGAGAGHNLHFLLPYVDAVATDISPAMLEVFHRVNPGVPTVVGDMRTLRLDRKFDAVLIHDAICHINTETDLEATFATARTHLEPGGLLLVTPDYTTETFREPMLQHGTTRTDKGHFSFQQLDWDPDPRDTWVEYRITYFIREGLDPLRVFHERQIMGLFAIKTWRRLFNKTGFSAYERPYCKSEHGLEKIMFAGVVER